METRLPGAQSVELQIRGIPGRYVTQVSDSFTNWQAVATNTTATGNLTVPLGPPTNPPALFYRTQQFVR